MMKKIILLSASLLVLAACTGADRPACWKANTKSANICNSSNGGGFSISKPDIKGKIGKRDKNNDVTTPATPDQETDTPAAPDTGNEDTPTPDTNDNTNENDNPSPSEDNNTPPDTTDNTSPPEEDTNPVSPPTQSNSNDIEGFDPSGGLYGPGT
jgi:hypothetical protein